MVGLAARHGVAAAPGIDIGRRQRGLHAAQLVRQCRFVLGMALDDVHALRRTFGVVREVILDAQPDRILSRQRQHLGVDGLDRGRFEFHQCCGAAQRRIEASVADVEQRRVPRDGHEIDLRLGDERQAPLRPAQDRVQIEVAVAVAQMDQVVPGHTPIESGKALGDQRRVVDADAVEQAMDRADPILPSLHLVELGLRQRPRLPHRAVEQDGPELEHMIARLAVQHRALPARVGGDHAAEGGAVGWRQLGRKEQAERFDGVVELILDHARLHARPAFLGVDLEDRIHVARQVDRNAARQGLAIGASAAATRRERNVAEARLAGQLCEAHHVELVARKDHGLRSELVDRVVGRKDGAIRISLREVALEAAQSQLREEVQVKRARTISKVERGNHGAGPLAGS